MPTKMSANMPAKITKNGCENATKMLVKILTTLTAEMAAKMPSKMPTKMLVKALNRDSYYAFLGFLGRRNFFRFGSKERRSLMKNQVKIKCVLKCVLALETSPV